MTAVEFAVRDFSLRARDSACAGARPFLGLRPGARVVVTGTGGAERATGTLREGRAIKATDIDFETAKREPTFCKFALVLSPQLPPGTYTFTAGDGRTAPLTEGESAGSVAVFFPSVGSPEDVLGPPPGSTPSVTP